MHELVHSSELGEAEPTCTPVHDERFVDNGKIITTAGLSSGIDGALHLVERYSDHFTAEQRANACGPSSKTERLQVAVPWGRRPAMSQTGDPTGADCGAVVE